jgi:hypothetical protein
MLLVSLQDPRCLCARCCFHDCLALTCDNSELEARSEKPNTEEIQQACAFLCMMCWDQQRQEDLPGLVLAVEQPVDEDSLSELPGHTDAHESRYKGGEELTRVMKRKRLSDASGTAPTSATTKSNRSPRDSANLTHVHTGTGGRESRNFSTSSDPTRSYTPQHAAAATTEPLGDGASAAPRSLICPVCTGPGRNPTDS